MCRHCSLYLRIFSVCCVLNGCNLFVVMDYSYVDWFVFTMFLFVRLLPTCFFSGDVFLFVYLIPVYFGLLSDSYD